MKIQLQEDPAWQVHLVQPLDELSGLLWLPLGLQQPSHQGYVPMEAKVVFPGRLPSYSISEAALSSHGHLLPESNRPPAHWDSAE